MNNTVTLPNKIAGVDLGVEVTYSSLTPSRPLLISRFNSGNAIALSRSNTVLLRDFLNQLDLGEASDA